MVTVIIIVHSLPLPLSDDVKKYLYINNQTTQFWHNKITPRSPLCLWVTICRESLDNHWSKILLLDNLWAYDLLLGEGEGEGEEGGAAEKGKGGKGKGKAGKGKEVGRLGKGKGERGRGRGSLERERGGGVAAGKE